MPPTYACKPFQEDAKIQALSRLQAGPDAVKQLEAVYKQHFASTFTQASQTFRGNDASIQAILDNVVVAKAVEATFEAVDQTLGLFSVLNRYINLTIPRMEDGGNFGVTIQLAALKQMSDTQEKLEKGLEDLSKYAHNRAEALSKCSGLAEVSKVQTAISSQSDSQGHTTEKGDQTSNDTKKSVEEKTTTTTNESHLANWRLQAVIAVDVQYYAKARLLYQMATTAYLTAVDFFDKNAQKLAQPKGHDEGAGSYRGMY